MAKPRTTLQALLETTTGFGNQRVAFQPGEDARMEYPAIAYEIDDTWSAYADNLPYATAERYQVTLMTRDPDDDAYQKLKMLPYCAFQRRFAVAGLNHYVFVIYH